MKKSIAMEWADLLESGEIKQGTGILNYKNNEMCCLGVLCNMAAVEGHTEAYNKLNVVTFGDDKDNSRTILPKNVMKWSGIKDPYGYIKSKSKCLTELNDNGESFEEIAKIIREHYKEL